MTNIDNELYCYSNEFHSHLPFDRPWLIEPVKKITKDYGIVDLLEPGDQIMADQGFDIESDRQSGVTLNISPFLDGKDQLP